MIMTKGFSWSTITGRVVLLLALGFMGIHCARVQASNMLHGNLSKNWPFVEGNLTSVDKHISGKSGHLKWYDVEYRYSVNGIEYSGDNVIYGQNSIEYSEQYWEGFKNNKRRTRVYYSPDKPSMSVLIPGDERAMQGLAWIVIALLIDFCVCYALIRNIIQDCRLAAQITNADQKINASTGITKENGGNY